MLLCITIPLSATLILRANQQDAKLPSTVEIPKTILGELIREAAKTAGENIKPDVEQMLDRVYAPVYEAIPAYANFHYSILGEYTELASVIFSEIDNAIRDRLYEGFDQRFKEAVSLADQKHTEAFNAALAERVLEKIELSPNRTLGPATKRILEDTLGRAKVVMSVAMIAAATTSIGATKIVSAAVAKKLAAKIAAKAAGKTAVKIGTTTTAAAAAAAACAWSGPLAAFCALTAAGVAWVTVDVVVMSLDEYISRDDFEAQLRKVIDEDRKDKKKLLENVLILKACAMAKNFTLRKIADEKQQPPEVTPSCYIKNEVAKSQTIR
jgi:hypothetical protein